MATITSAASGNFSDTATWVGGVVPTVGDVAVAATGHVIVIDVDVTVDEVDQAGTGKFTLGNGRTLTANITARAGTFTTGGTVEVIATSGNTATIVGNIDGVSTTAASIAGVVVSGDGRLEFTGDITGSAGNASSAANANAAMYISGAADVDIDGDLLGGTGNAKTALTNVASGGITITGNVEGGAFNSHGLKNESSATITITGNVTGGQLNTSSATAGVFNTGAAIINITGAVFAGTTVGIGISNGSAATITITGNLAGGGGAIGAANAALNNTGAATITATGAFTADRGAALNNANASASIACIGSLIPGDTSTITNTQPGANLQCTGPFLVSAAGIQAVNSPALRFYDNSPTFYQIRTADLLQVRTLYSPNDPDSQSGQAAEADVKDGVTYGPAGELTGTFEQTKVATLADIVTAVWDTQLSTLSDAATTGGRIRRTATVESTGAQIEALGITP
jgi:hypothetical protein